RCAISVEATSPTSTLPNAIGRNAISIKNPDNAEMATSRITTLTPANFRCAADRVSRLSERSSNPMNDPIRATGCDSRRHSQSGSPIKASNARAAMTTKSVSLQINTSVRHALEFRGETVECFRQSRATAYGQLFRDYKALRGRVEALQRRMQQEGPALVLGKVTGVG